MIGLVVLLPALFVLAMRLDHALRRIAALEHALDDQRDANALTLKLLNEQNAALERLEAEPPRLYGRDPTS